MLIKFIAKEEKISISEKELTDGMINYSSQYPGQEKQILEYFKKTPVSEALGTVKKANVKKFERALGVMEAIIEDTTGWLDENNL